MNSTWRAGATLVLLPRFDAARAIELMVREKVNTFHGVPTMFVSLAAAAADAAALPELRICISGGASLPVAVLERFEKAFGAKIYEGYGLSETSPTATVNQPCFGTRAGTIGHPLWGVDVEIARAEVDDRVELLPPGELGEVVIRGHNVFSGYLGRPEATAEAVVDYNVYPREVEEVLMRHPGIAQAAVIGLPDDLHGEEVCAIVVPAPGAAPDAAAITEWSKEHLGRHKYPRRVEVTDSLPLGPSMKILKRELRARYAGS
jgi:long-chain acyl-CoA synthetase